MEKKCFDFDWGKCAIPKIVKSQNDLEEIKNLLWKNYKVIRNVFRHYSSYQPMGEIPAI